LAARRTQTPPEVRRAGAPAPGCKRQPRGLPAKAVCTFQHIHAKVHTKMTFQAFSCHAVLRRQHGLITRRQALLHGVTVGQIASRLRNGQWQAAARGVYRLAGTPRTYAQRVLTACLSAGDEAVASHATAAILLSLAPNVVKPEPIQISVPRASSRRIPVPAGVVVHRPRSLLPRDRAVVGGIPVTKPGRTIVDLAACLPAMGLNEVVDEAFFRYPTLSAAALARRHAAGTKAQKAQKLKAALAPWMEGAAPGSPAEMRLFRRLVESGLPAPVRQHEIFDAAGAFVARADLAYPEAKIAIEYLGERHHGPRRTAADEVRRNAMIDVDWLPMHTTAEDEEDRFIRQVARQLRARLSRR
jgi:hypothetical protein